MLTQDCIEKIKDVPVSDIVRHYLPDLKKKGVNWQACCPFHAEKSPSFSVNDVKGIYKCFGCGEGGGGINFVMKHDRLNFYEACVKIADLAHIELEHEASLTEEQQQAYKDRKTAAGAQEDVLNFVIPLYQKMLHDLAPEHPAKLWLTERGLDDDSIAAWNIGWAGDDWNTVSTPLVNKGLYEAAHKMGIIKRSQDNTSNYDGYKNRIIFPITDKNGRYIGLGGRYIKTSANDSYAAAKYINPSECDLYSKSNVLFGFAKAAKAIKEAGFAYVTEGYMDVISPARLGIHNVVGTCGTAFTKQQMILLKKITNHLVIWRDNDAAGENSFARALPDLLSEGFKVDRAKYEGKDPDAWVQSLPFKNNIQCLDKPVAEDALVYHASKMWQNAGDMYSKASAKTEILKLIVCISNDILRNNYLDSLTKQFGWKANDTKKEFSNIVEWQEGQDLDAEFEESIKFPEWMTDDMKDAVLSTGYIAVNRMNKGKPMVGYYSFNQNGKTEITNFIINPLFRIEAGQESRYLSEIDNGHRKAVVDMPAKVFPSIEQFQGMCVAAGGAFIIYGAKLQWLRIATDLLHKYKVCIEVSSLGWQEHGFFAWVDKAYIPDRGEFEYNKWGILEHKEKNFLVPASSEAYKQLQLFGSDPYENQRTLTKRTSPVKFGEWARQMEKVYKTKGTVGVAYAILTLFRDIVFKVDNNCPHLYGFGEPSSGKSKWAESITAIFFYRRAAFNLNSGTDYAFFSYMSMFHNCPAHLNEFDIEVVNPEWFQAIKGAYDGEGRVRGKLGSKNSTEIQKIVSTLVLTGQKLVTADDNSVVTRSLIEPFSTEEYTEDQRHEYNLLKEWEANGLSSILVEALNHRRWIEAEYKNHLNEQLGTWRREKKQTLQMNNRILQNFAHLATCYKMMHDKLDLPAPANEFTEYCYQQAVKWSGFIRSSDTLSEFWRTLEFLVNQGLVEEGWDFAVESETDLTISLNRNENCKKSFDQPTRVLFIRINNLHKLFQKEYKLRTNKEAMSLENLLHYFSSRKYFIGSIKNRRFYRHINTTDEVIGAYDSSIQRKMKKEEKITSCYAFLYDELEIDITRGVTENKVQPMQAATDDDVPFPPIKKEVVQSQMPL